MTTRWRASTYYSEFSSSDIGILQTDFDGDDFNIGQWVQAANSLQGILTKLGLHRVAKDVPDIAEYLAAR